MNNRAAASMYLALADHGLRNEEDQLSRARKAFLALCAVLVLAATPLFWTNAAQAGDSGPQALASSSGPVKDGDRDDNDDSGSGGNSGPGGGNDNADDDDTVTRNTADSVTTTNSADTGPGTNTRTDTNTRGDNTRGEVTGDDDTRGKTGDGRDRMTGRETGAANTDRGGLNTGVSTRGETDRGDQTGNTERR